MSGLDQARFREVLAHFATGITIVTALEDGEPVGFTCQSFAALSLDPPMVILAPARSSTSWPRIAKAGAFCVNILEEHQEALSRTFAVSGGDKFEGVGWTPGVTGAPVLEGALVGLHYHLRQSDYWYALRGRVRVVLHDLRVGSPTEGKTEVNDLDGDVDQGVYIPPGVAHGFAALTDVLLTYLVDNYYDNSDELGLAWDDPEVGADWGLANPILSTRDQSNPRRGDIADDVRPRYAT